MPACWQQPQPYSRRVVNLPFNELMPYQAVRPYINLAPRLGKLQGQLAGGWITRLEVELLGEGLRALVRPVTAVLLSGLLLPVDGRPVNWVSAPVLASEQGIAMAQVKGLAQQPDYPNLIACRVYWEAGDPPGQRTLTGVVFGNGEARLVQYDRFNVDAFPEGYLLILENDDLPGVIGKIAIHLGETGVNIALLRNSRLPASLLAGLEREPEIHRPRLVRL